VIACASLTRARRIKGSPCMARDRPAWPFRHPRTQFVA
jgi:hypothetical protein